MAVSLLIAIVMIFAFIGLWHVVLVPMFGITLVLSAAAWSLGVYMIIGLVLVTLLFFVLPLMGIFIVAGLVTVGVIMSIVLFPILFPLLVPVLIICLFMGHCRRRRYKEIYFD